MEEQQKSYYAIIPANVRYDKSLPPNAKLLYGEITALCNEKGFCWATNNYFAELYGVSKTTISRWLRDLKEKSYISIEMIYKEGSKEIDNRYIRICGEGIYKNVNTPIVKNVKDNNTLKNNTNNNTIINSTAEAEPITTMIKEIIEYMNNCGVLENFKVKKTFSFNPKANSNIKIIKARINEDNTLDDFKDVIYHTYDKFVENEFKGLNGKSSIQYYRPSTLFSSENMEKYKNEYKNL